MEEVGIRNRGRKRRRRDDCRRHEQQPQPGNNYDNSQHTDDEDIAAIHRKIQEEFETHGPPPTGRDRKKKHRKEPLDGDDMLHSTSFTK